MSTPLIRRIVYQVDDKALDSAIRKTKEFLGLGKGSVSSTDTERRARVYETTGKAAEDSAKKQIDAQKRVQAALKNAASETRDALAKVRRDLSRGLIDPRQAQAQADALQQRYERFAQRVQQVAGASSQAINQTLAQAGRRTSAAYEQATAAVERATARQGAAAKRATEVQQTALQQAARAADASAKAQQRAAQQTAAEQAKAARQAAKEQEAATARVVKSIREMERTSRADIRKIQQSLAAGLISPSQAQTRIAEVQGRFERFASRVRGIVGPTSREINSQLGRSLRLVGEDAEQTGRRANSAFAQIRRATEATQRSVADLQGRVRGIGGTLRTFAVSLAAGLSFRELVEGAARVEQLRVSFSSLIPDAREADRVLKELINFAATTPFEMAGVQQAARQLLASGTATSDLTERLRMLGDVAAGSGQRIEDIALVYQQVANKGRLYAEEILQFNERGIPLQEALAEALGKTREETSLLVTQGRVGIDALNAAFGVLTQEGGKFYQQTEKQSQTFLGRLSTLRDNLVITFQGAFAEAFSAVSEDIGRINSEFDRLGSNTEAQATLRQLSDAFVAAYKIVVAFLGVLVRFGPQLLAAGAAVLVVRTAMVALRVATIATTGTLALARVAAIALSGVMALLTGNITRAIAAWRLLKVVIASNPIGAAVTILAAVAAAFYTATQRANAFSQALADQRRQVRALTSDLQSLSGEQLFQREQEIKLDTQQALDRLAYLEEKIAALKENYQTVTVELEDGTVKTVGSGGAAAILLVNDLEEERTRLVEKRVGLEEAGKQVQEAAAGNLAYERAELQQIVTKARERQQVTREVLDAETRIAEINRLLSPSTENLLLDPKATNAAANGLAAAENIFRDIVQEARLAAALTEEVVDQVQRLNDLEDRRAKIQKLLDSEYAKPEQKAAAEAQLALIEAQIDRTEYLLRENEALAQSAAVISARLNALAQQARGVTAGQIIDPTARLDEQIAQSVAVVNAEIQKLNIAFDAGEVSAADYQQRVDALQGTLRTGLLDVLGQLRQADPTGVLSSLYDEIEGGLDRTTNATEQAVTTITRQIQAYTDEINRLKVEQQTTGGDARAFEEAQVTAAERARVALLAYIDTLGDLRNRREVIEGIAQALEQLGDREARTFLAAANVQKDYQRRLQQINEEVARGARTEASAQRERQQAARDAADALLLLIDRLREAGALSAATEAQLVEMAAGFADETRGAATELEKVVGQLDQMERRIGSLGRLADAFGGLSDEARQFLAGVQDGVRAMADLAYARDQFNKGEISQQQLQAQQAGAYMDAFGAAVNILNSTIAGLATDLTPAVELDRELLTTTLENITALRENTNALIRASQVGENVTRDQATQALDILQGASDLIFQQGNVLNFSGDNPLAGLENTLAQLDTLGIEGLNTDAFGTVGQNLFDALVNKLESEGFVVGREDEAQIAQAVYQAVLFGNRDLLDQIAFGSELGDELLGDSFTGLEEVLATLRDSLGLFAQTVEGALGRFETFKGLQDLEGNDALALLEESFAALLPETVAALGEDVRAQLLDALGTLPSLADAQQALADAAATGDTAALAQATAALQAIQQQYQAVAAQFGVSIEDLLALMDGGPILDVTQALEGLGDLDTQAGQDALQAYIDNLIQGLRDGTSDYLDVFTPAELEQFIQALQSLRSEAEAGATATQTLADALQSYQDQTAARGLEGQDAFAQFLSSLDATDLLDPFLAQFAGIDVTTEAGQGVLQDALNQIADQLLTQSGDLFDTFGADGLRTLLGALAGFRQAADSLLQGAIAQAGEQTQIRGLTGQAAFSELLTGLDATDLVDGFLQPLLGIGDVTTQAGQDALNAALGDIAAQLAAGSGALFDALGEDDLRALALALVGFRDSVEQAAEGVSAFQRGLDRFETRQDFLNLEGNDALDAFASDLRDQFSFRSLQNSGFGDVLDTVQGADVTTQAGRDQVQGILDAVLQGLLTQSGFLFDFLGADDLKAFGDTLQDILDGVEPGAADEGFSKSVQIGNTITEFQANELLAYQREQLMELREINASAAGMLAWAQSLSQGLPALPVPGRGRPEPLEIIVQVPVTTITQVDGREIARSTTYHEQRLAYRSQGGASTVGGPSTR